MSARLVTGSAPRLTYWQRMMKNDGNVALEPEHEEPIWKSLLNHNPPALEPWQPMPTNPNAIKQAIKRNQATTVPRGRIRKSRHKL